jgi:serine/threonine protein kinase
MHDACPIGRLRTVYFTNRREYFRQVAEIGCQVAAALAHAHETGIVHRDVKPGNILIDRYGRPWITDFGLARMDAETSVTVSGDLLGTLRSMSPEQASGNHQLVDHRVDIYSLGATLYELAGGMRRIGHSRKARELCLTALTELTRLEDHLGDTARFFTTRARTRSLLASLTPQLDDARSQAELAVEDQRLAVQREPDNWQYVAALSSLLNQLAIKEFQSGHWDAEAVRRRERLKLSRLVLQHFPAAPNYQADLVDALKDWGSIEQRTGAHERALAHYREALEQAQRLLALYPDYLEHQRLVARTSIQFGELLLRLDRSPEAIDVLLPARPIWLELVNREPGEITHIHNRLQIDLFLARAHAASPAE